MKISYLTPSREYVQILRHNTVLEENKKKTCRTEIIRSSNFDHVPATSLYYTKRHNKTFYLYFLFFQHVRILKKTNMQKYIYIRH